MSTSLTRLSRGAIATLTVLLAACSGGGATDGDGEGLDFTPPSIDILTPEDTTTVVDRAQPFAMSVDVADNSELRRVRTELFDGLDKIFSEDTTFLGAQIVTRYIMSGTADISDRDVGKLMHLIVTAFDGAGNQFSDTLPFLTTSVGAPPLEVGPTVRLEMPLDTIMYPGREVRFRVTALDPDGIAQIADTIRGSGMPTTVQTHDVVTSPLLDSLSIDTVFNIPTTTQIGTNIFFVGVARDGNGQFGNAVRRRFIIERQPGDTLGPLVRQTVPVRLEDSASFSVRAEDLGRVRRIGYRVTTSAGVHVDSGSVLRTTASTVDTYDFRIRFGQQYRGQTVIIYSFADDTAGNRGYSVASNVTVPQMTAANARVDRPLLVYGRTFPLPAGGSGADIAVDTTRRVAYVSNFAQNRLEAWNFANASSITRLSPVLVGSQPWGMALEIGGTRLLVANSGGTNLDVIDLVSRTQVARYSTPNTRLWYITETINDSDGSVKYSGEYFDYSDRPQYVAMSENGNIYFSTRPTASAPEGTIRRIDPDIPGELEQIWQYGDESPLGQYSIVNADAVTIYVSAGTGLSDTLEVCDHAVGGGPGSICRRGTSAVAVAAAIRAAGGDAVAERVTAESLALTDTTFVAVGGDRRWVAFGEGNTAGRPGRIMMVYDPLGSTTLNATPGISVRDLTDNASDRVTGVAINSNSTTVGVHGTEAYFAEISEDYRFQLRLQGKFATSGSGSGIVFHPQNDGTSDDTNRRRVSFVGAGDPKVQIIDSYFFRMRGELELAAPLYGPLRAINPTAAEAAAGVTVKLFGLSANGLVIIDVLNSDIAP